MAAFVHGRNGKHGWWVAGVVRPSLTTEQILDLKAGSLSGDWRAIGTGLEGVAALVVNVPGFPIPRQQAFAASGRPQALVAAGAQQVAHTDCGCGGSATQARLEALEREMARQRNLNAPRELAALSASIHRHTEADLDLASLRLRG